MKGPDPAEEVIHILLLSWHFVTEALVRLFLTNNLPSVYPSKQQHVLSKLFI